MMSNITHHHDEATSTGVVAHDVSKGMEGFLSFPTLLPAAETNELKKSFLNFFQSAQKRHLSSVVIVSIMDDAAEMLTERESRGGGLTDEQAQFLVSSGAMTAEELEEAEASVANGDLAEDERKTRLGAIADSLSAEEVAVLLGISVSRVRHRQREDQLFSFKIGAKRLYPKWQFSDSATPQVIPHITTVVRSIPSSMHPATVQGFMTSPQRTMIVDGTEVTPIEWLQMGGDKQDIVDMFEAFLRS